MPCITRMKIIFLQGLLWLLLIGFGVMALSPEPGFLDFDNLPDTNFSCVGKVIGGYYADLETNCQMFHVCTIGQLDEPMDIRFLCLNGTVFDQETRVCERIDEVDCSKSEKFYSLNLELYGNTQPPILEDRYPDYPPSILFSEPHETDQPPKPSTTSTSTTTPRPKFKPTRRPFFTTHRPPPLTTSKTISSHHFPINSNSPDIRFNPEEINISLNPGAPPDISSKPISFQQQSFGDSHHSNNKRVIVTTHTTVHKHEAKLDNDHEVQKQHHDSQKLPKLHQLHHSTQKPHQQTVTSTSQGFYHQENEYRTDAPHNGFIYQQSHPYHEDTNYRPDYTSSTRRYIVADSPTTFKNDYHHQVIKTNSQFTVHRQDERTEKPERLQLPLPLLPTVGPLVFSTPAPFALTRHIDSKRFTSDHPPPRIIISASASVSDASGRRLNYSLGTIGTAHLIEPSSYEEYKDDDISIDSFYHDVPKLKRSRRKREIIVDNQPGKIFDTEEEAVDALKFLFDWYRDYRTTREELSSPVTPEIIEKINDQFSPSDQFSSTVATPLTQEQSLDSIEVSSVERPEFASQEISGDYKVSPLFHRKSRFNIVGDVISITESTKIENKLPQTTPLSVSSVATKEWEEYVDDNYEPLAYQEQYKNNPQVKNTAYSNDKERILVDTSINVPVSLLNKEYYSRLNNISSKNDAKANKPHTSRGTRKFINTFLESEFKNSIRKAVDPLTSTSTTERIESSKVDESNNTVTEISRNIEENSSIKVSPVPLTTMAPKIDHSGNKTNITEFYYLYDAVQYTDIGDLDSINESNYTQNIDKEVAEKITSVSDVVKSNQSSTISAEITTTEKTYSENETTIDNAETEFTTTSQSTTDLTTSTNNDEDIGTRHDLIIGHNQTINERIGYESEEETKNETMEQNERTLITSSYLITSTTPVTVDPEVTTQNYYETSTLMSTTFTPTDFTSQTTSTQSYETSTASLQTSTQQSNEEISSEQTNLPLTTQLQKYIEEIEENTRSVAKINLETTKLESTTSPLVELGKTSVEFKGTTEKIPDYRRNNSFSRYKNRSPKYRSRNRKNKTQSSKESRKHRFGSTESLKSQVHPSITDIRTEILQNYNARSVEISPTLSPGEDDVPSTDPPFSRSANPTQDGSKLSLETTPLSTMLKESTRNKLRKNFIFNCIGRVINKFYSDPRDCRLFHYCTRGFTKSQLLDMKFVCEQSTYFDDEKLICTKEKPLRCL